MKLRVGSDIEAICRKCGEVWHVVVAQAEGRIAKVECKQCGARHRYRPVDGGAAAPPRRTSGRRSPPRRSRTARPVVEADPSRPRRAFRPSETYQVGDRILHTRFGEGIVQAVTGPSKIEVLFDAGPKILVHARGAG